MMLLTKAVILASASPRRRELLEQLGVSFRICVSSLEEARKPNEAPEHYVVRNAREKAFSVLSLCSPQTDEAVILGADTVVTSADGNVLEKPLDVSHAGRMLRSLSGQAHRVCTGFALVDLKSQKLIEEQCVITEVEFKSLTDAEISAYLATGEPFDKAGAYGIQGYGGAFVRSIRGSYTNVVGLPICEVWEALTRHARIPLFRGL